MKLLLLLVPILCLAESRQIIDRIESMKLKKNGYVVNFERFEKSLFVNYSSATIPCLENANKADMEVILRLDDKNSEIRDCKIYTNPRVLNYRKTQDTDGVPGVWQY